jgi:hypothetical protein
MIRFRRSRPISMLFAGLMFCLEALAQPPDKIAIDNRTPGIIAIFLVISGVSACAHQSQTPADIVLIHAGIYTVNAEEHRAQGIAIREGKIIAVGSDKEIAAHQGASTKIIDAKKHMVLPGFIDAHVHIRTGASQLEQISQNDAKTLDDFQELVKDYAVAHRKGMDSGRGLVLQHLRRKRAA